MYSGVHNESSIEDQHAEGGELTSDHVERSTHTLAEEMGTSRQHLGKPFPYNIMFLE